MRRDLYLTHIPLDTQKHTREAIALHALDHVTKFANHDFVSTAVLTGSS